MPQRALALALSTSLLACAPPRALLVARSQLGSGDYLAARQTLRAPLAREPGDDTLAGLAMRAFFASGSTAEAVALYRARPSDARRRELALARLWSAMRHHDPVLRLAAIQSARRLDAAPLAEEMVRRLSDPDPVVKTWAAVALSATPVGAELLGRQLEARQAAARVVAIREVGRLAGKAARSQIEKFVTDPAPAVRTACADALSHGDATASRALLLRLARDASAEVRMAAYRALATLGIHQGAPLLADAIKSGAKAERRAALTAFAALARPEEGKSLCRALVADADLGLALLAGRHLARWGESQPVLDTIALALLQRRPSLRVAALATASGVRDAVAYALARKALSDPDPQVRLAAASLALSKGRDVGRARAVATRTLSQVCPQQQSLCLEAARLAARAGDPSGARELRRLARAGDDYSTRVAALALLQGEQDALIGAFLDPDVRVGLAAAEHLWRKR